jgi:hypothetical protein
MWDRGALAFAGALVGALTLGGYIVASMFLFPRGALALTWAVFASPLGIGFIALCTLAGAFCPPERLASFFSVLWGTHTGWESPQVQRIGTVLILLLLVVAIYHRFHLR